MGVRAGATTRANTSTSTCAAPARNNARGAGLDCGTGREHVVDQHQAPAGHFDPVFRWDQKCPLDVIGALRSRPSDLLGRCTDTFESAMRNRDAGNRRYRAGKNGRLLYRRAHRLRQCRGTGTSASASASSSWPARAIQRPIMGERSSRSLYLKPCTRVLATSS
jgi:hypothetical protein